MSSYFQKLGLLSALSFGLAVMPAFAGETRTANFLFTCDGTNKTVPLVLGGFAASSNHVITGGAMILFESPPQALQYVLARGDVGDSKKSIVSMSLTDVSARYNNFFSSLPITASAAGNILVQIDGACNPGKGQIQGNLTVYFD